MQEHLTTHAWESLIPSSFQDTLYLPSLKISVTAGSFVTYSASQGISTASPSRRNVGRIIEVVTSKDLVEGYETNPLINAVIPEAIGNDVRVHFAKVNIFKDRQMLCDTMFPVDDDEHGVHTGWQRIVQLNKCAWIPSHLINGLAFVALENKKDAIMRDDCQGMGDFFVAKYRIGGDGMVSIIPQHACPPFAGHIDGFDNTWSTDFCELIFKSMLQIKREVQRILCRVAQSQGDFAVRTAKVQLPNGDEGDLQHFWRPIQPASFCSVLGPCILFKTVYWVL
ncbi:hypothetical protein MHU86_8357 [Fragilaria crotonensis]|nr:hypothetical protein MHU86_8357 [Fragilaria crotonensis]